MASSPLTPSRRPGSSRSRRRPPASDCPSAAHDYVLAVDQFGSSYPWPSAAALTAAGDFDQHFAHMRAFWDAELRKIAQVRVPDPQLNNAYRSGLVYTLIARAGFHSNTGVNNYESEFSHDVVGILANLFTQGDYDDAHALLLDARGVVGVPEYVDGLWTYAWPWAVYLLKTGDLTFVKANFSTAGPAGATQPSIEASADSIAAYRTGPNGIIGVTNDIDSNGYWTVDNYEALVGLAAYRYLAERVGDATEARWADAEYNSLLASVNATLAATMRRYHLDYLPCSMVEPNTANRCSNPRDANWAAPFLFGRWPWDAQLFGAAVSAPAAQLIDATYVYGFRRLVGVLPADTFGGYPGHDYSSGYNVGYGSGGLAGTSVSRSGDPELRVHAHAHAERSVLVVGKRGGADHCFSLDREPPDRGGGSSPHAWGIANAQQGLARLARCPGRGRNAHRRPRRSRQVGDVGRNDLGHELPHHERHPRRCANHRGLSVRHAEPVRFNRHGSVPTPPVRRQHCVVDCGDH